MTIVRSIRQKTIAAAATDLFADRGFGGVSVEDIATAVGVTPGALYRHFRGKGAVLSAVLEDTTDRLLALTEGSAGSLRELVAGTVTFALDQPGLLATYVRERQRVEDPDLRAKERRLFDAWARAMGQAAPALDHGGVVLRQRALIGALPALTRRPLPVDRPRLDELVTNAMLRVVTCPPPPPAAAKPVDTPAWRPRSRRRDEILAAALALFREHGFGGATVDEIGRSAGLAGSGLYRYYADKTEVLLDAYDLAGARVEVGAENSLAAAADAADALRRLARSYAEVAFSDVDLIVVTAREGFAIPEAERAGLDRRTKRVQELWFVVLRELRPDLADVEAQVLIEAVFPLINQVALADGSIDEAVALPMALFEEGPQ